MFAVSCLIKGETRFYNETSMRWEASIEEARKLDQSDADELLAFVVKNSARYGRERSGFTIVAV